jgi:hypothetical protein
MMGIHSRSDEPQLWYEYFNLHKKTIKQQARKVHLSREFQCPEHLQSVLTKIITKVECGDDLNPHLSKNALCPSEFDDLLYDWGIYHLHMSTKIDQRTGFVRRTGPLVFAMFDNDNAYFINVYSHGKNVAPPWSKQDMMKIIHANWPDAIARHRLPGVVQAYPESARHPTDYAYAALRKSHITTLLEVDEGVAYLFPGGGYTASGHSAEIIRRCNNIHNTLKLNEINIQEKIDSITKEIERKAIMSLGLDIHFLLWYENNALWVIEPKTFSTVVEIRL